MQDSFYRNFINEQDRTIALIGGGGKSTLIQRICKDCYSLKKRVLVLSLFPFNSPLDTNVVTTDHVDELENLVKRELKSHGVLYLARSYDKGALINFSTADVKKIIKNAPVDHIFIEADLTHSRSLSSYHRVPVSLLGFFDRIINLIGADALNQVNNPNWLESNDPFWAEKSVIQPMDIFLWIQTHPVFKKLEQKQARITQFINKVENTFIENLSIPLAKELKLTGMERVILGSVFNSNLHIIK